MSYPASPVPPRFIIITILLILFLALGGWWFFAPRDDGSLADIRRRGTLRVGLDASFPPFETLDPNGQVVGLDADIARAIAADLGVKVEFVNIGFDGLYDALLARRVEMIISGLPYDSRLTGDVAYTTNYFNAGQVLVTRAAEPAISGAKDLAGHTVAVEWGSQAEMVARQWQNRAGGAGEPAQAAETTASIILLRQDTAAAALEIVRTGQAEAAIVDAPSALGGLAAAPPGGQAKGLKIVTYLTDEWYAAAVHLQSRELLGAVNQTLARLQQSGEMAQWQTRWFQPAP